MIGKLVYKLRATFHDGFDVWWYRDIVRHRILKSEPVRGLVDSRCEIHVLTSSDDYLNLIWALKSFYLFSGRCYKLAIHDDGTLADVEVGELKRHFPDARIICRGEADSTVISSLCSYPNCKAFRETNKLALKVFDFRYYLESDRMLLLDSDVLFFSEPVELLGRIEEESYRRNTVNSDVQSAYTVDPILIKEKFEFELIEKFNSGLGLIHHESMNLEWIEEFLTIPGVIGHHWRIEQTLYALFSCRFGAELLPPKYNVFLTGRLNDQPSRHYVGAIRHEMYREGVKRLQVSGLLNGK